MDVTLIKDETFQGYDTVNCNVYTLNSTPYTLEKNLLQSVIDTRHRSWLKLPTLHHLQQALTNGVVSAFFYPPAIASYHHYFCTLALFPS